MLVIGITGSFGTGKTTVASIFRELGATVIDADALAHRALKKNSAAYRVIVKTFGSGILAGNGRIDRRALAEKIFSSPRNVKRLNAIVHPQVIAKIKEEISSAGESDIIVIDAPLLLEAGLDNITDHIIVVTASRDAQVGRSMKKFGLDKEDVEKRIRHQLSLKEKVKRGDFIIDNNGTKKDTRKQVEKIWRSYNDNVAH